MVGPGRGAVQAATPRNKDTERQRANAAGRSDKHCSGSFNGSASSFLRKYTQKRQNFQVGIAAGGCLTAKGLTAGRARQDTGDPRQRPPASCAARAQGTSRKCCRGAARPAMSADADPRARGSGRPPAAGAASARPRNRSPPGRGRSPEESPVIAIGAQIGAGRMGEELGQRLGRDEFGLVIDRGAEDLERHAPPQHLLGGGGIDGHSRAGVVQKPRQLAAADEMHAIRHAQSGGDAGDIGLQLRAAVLQRMGLEDQMMVPRRALGEALDRHLQEFGHRAEGRMLLEARIVLELQKRQMIEQYGVGAKCTRRRLRIAVCATGFVVVVDTEVGCAMHHVIGHDHAADHDVAGHGLD